MPLEFHIPSLNFFLLHLAYGLMAGLMYAVFSVGLTVVWGVSKIVNFAHGEFYTMGGYLFFVLTTYLGINNYLALPLTVLVVMAIGLLVEKTVIRPAYTMNLERVDEYGIIVTFGILIVIQNTVLQIAGPWRYRPPAFWGDVVEIGEFSVVGDRIVAAVISGVILIMLAYFFSRTWLGRAIRAASQHRLGAQMLGINLERVIPLSFMLGVGLAAASGALLSYVFVVNPFMGLDPVIKAFVVIVIGGMGSILGAALGGILLGASEGVATAFLGGSYVKAYGFVMLILFLILRPHGFFGEKVRRV